MNTEQIIARQIAFAVSMAAIAGNGEDLEKAIKLAEDTIREAIQEERDAVVKIIDSLKISGTPAEGILTIIKARK